MMAEDRAIPITSFDVSEEWTNKQAALILSKLADIDKKQNSTELCLGNLMKKIDTLCGSYVDVSPELESSNDAADGKNSGNIQKRMLKTETSIAERQTQIILLLENMNQTFIRDAQEILHQVGQMNEKQDDIKKNIDDLRNRWSLLRANIFGISFLVVGTSAFIVFTTVIIARKINKINQFYRVSISDVVTDILKRNKTSVNAAEIVSKLRGILVTPTRNLKPDYDTVM